MARKSRNKPVSVSQQVFDQFLKELEIQGVSKEVVVYLGETFADGNISVEALKSALVPDDNTNI